MNFSPTGNAWVRRQQLLSQTMHSSTLSLLEKVEVQAGSRALCLNCGEGEVVFHLSGLIGENGSVMGIDPSEENVNTAQQLSRIKNIGNASFCKTEQYGPGNGQTFEFIHCRLPLIRFFDPVKFMEEIRAQLTPGGVALFEVIDFSGFNSMPENFAFERSLDLYAAHIRLQWGDAPFSTKLGPVLSLPGFRQVQHQYVAPAFLQGAAKHLPSLTLECIRDEVVNQKLSSRDEIQVLLHELKSFERKAHSLISLPGIHQIWGIKHEHL